MHPGEQLGQISGVGRWFDGSVLKLCELPVYFLYTTVTQPCLWVQLWLENFSQPTDDDSRFQKDNSWHFVYKALDIVEELSCQFWRSRQPCCECLWRGPWYITTGYQALRASSSQPVRNQGLLSCRLNKSILSRNSSSQTSGDKIPFRDPDSGTQAADSNELCPT